MGLISTLKKKGKKAVKGVKNFAEDRVENVKDAVTDPVGTYTDAVESTVDKVRDVGEAYKDGYETVRDGTYKEDIIEPAVTKMNERAGEIKDWTGKVDPQLVRWGGTALGAGLAATGVGVGAGAALATAAHGAASGVETAHEAASRAEQGTGIIKDAL